MGFGLFGLKGDSKNQIQNQKGAEQSAPSSDTAGRYKLAQEIRNLLPGQTISGEVLERNGNEVQLRVGQDNVILARIDNTVNITVGQNMTFEIKKNGEHQLALRPLFENLAQDPNILKALDAAGIQTNDKTTQMVSYMMEKGLPIDKNTLLQVYRDVTANQDEALMDIVLLHKLKLPVTAENLSQIRQYGNLEHQILNAIDTVLEELPQELLSMIKEGSADGISKATQFLKEVVAVLTEGQNASAETVPQKEPPAGGIPVTPEETAAETPKGTFVHAEGELPSFVLTAEKEILFGIQGTPKEQEAVGKLLKGLGLQVQGGMETDTNTLLKLVLDTMLKQPLTKDGFEKLASSKGMKLLLRDSMEKSMLLLPEQIAEKEEVDKLYERIYEQTAKLSKILQQSGRESAPLAKSVENIRSNVEFMNQLNQTFTYIQLPIKMTGQKANGDLYVYTNKKNLAKEDGQVSALLHLDMEHLGSMDIYVAMQGERVNTKFYLQKEEMLDFINDHIYLLNERLEKRGYQLNAEMMYREEMTGPLQEMIQESGKTSMLASYSFDVRA